MGQDWAPYKEKAGSYFENVRREILPLLPTHVDRILEVGCGGGDTLSFLKSSGRCEWVGGIEIFHEAAANAKGKVDVVLEGSIEEIKLPFDEGSIDVVLCLDVLEHLIDPWSAIHRMHSLLRPGGLLICSIPNIRNFRALLPLLLLGQWQYSKEGILDKTHLRFFTKKSAMELVECSGLVVDMVEATGLEKWNKVAIANLLSLSVFKPFFEFQYLIRATNKNAD